MFKYPAYPNTKANEEKVKSQEEEDAKKDKSDWSLTCRKPTNLFVD